MKGRYLRGCVAIQSSVVLLIAAVIGGLAGSAQAQLMAHQNTQATFSGALGGLSSWNVDGINYLTQESYRFRIGAGGGELGLSSITASPIITQSYGVGGQQLTALYSNSTLGIQINYTFAGGSAGSGKSGVTEQIGIYNYSGSALDLHFFHYSDFDLPGMNNAQMINSVGGSTFNRALQTGLPGTENTTLLSFAANYAEAGLFPSTLNGLIDGNPTSFLGSATTAGPGNVAYAFQWDLNLAANTGSRLFSVIQNLQVPEPSSLALALMGFAGWFAMRRRAA